MTRRRLMRVGAGLLAGGVIWWAKDRDDLSGQGHPDSAAVPLYQRCSFGAYAVNAPYPDVWPHYGLQDIVQARLGCMSWFVDMDTGWLDEPAQDAANSGHDICIAWDPRVARKPFPLAEISSGLWDERLTAFFRKAAEFPRTVTIRPFWEMNGDYYPYSMSYSGGDRQVTSTEEFRNTWRHLVSLQRSVGGRNIRWFFCVNNDDLGDYRMEDYYPGSGYVDVLGLDCYGDNRPPRVTFDQHIRPMYDRVAALDPRLPITLGELGYRTAGGTDGQDKAQWIHDMFESTQFSRLTQINFFHAGNHEADWRLNSSPAALAEFRRFLALAPGGSSAG
jgi:beta-mannanase